MTTSVNASAASWQAIKSMWRQARGRRGRTGVALIFVNAEGENVIGIHAGANAALSVAQVEAESADRQRAGVVDAAGVTAERWRRRKSPITIRPPCA
jgi:sugar/nucleoside kinase (ribokinase family)